MATNQYHDYAVLEAIFIAAGNSCLSKYVQVFMSSDALLVEFRCLDMLQNPAYNTYHTF